MEIQIAISFIFILLIFFSLTILFLYVIKKIISTDYDDNWYWGIPTVIFIVISYAVISSVCIGEIIKLFTK